MSGHVKRPPSDEDKNAISKIPRILPHERVFPIQIGSELFKLSGASLSSDAPSYFSQYFQCQIKQAQEAGEDVSNAIRTLYIDRDPDTFKDIALHLQGYHVTPRDGTHFVRLFADAQFYSLPKLISQLYDESIFMSIGHKEFQIPKDLFTDPGNSPNFFSLGFAVFFSSPDDLFPGLDREGLQRPPSILPPSVPNRSAETFSEILHLLRGYPVHVRDEAHRAALLRDCRYFNFKGLEQKLIPHHIGFNQGRRREEIVIRIEEILKSGISLKPEPTQTDSHAAWVNYSRPYVDDKAFELILEIGGESTKLHFPAAMSTNNNLAVPSHRSVTPGSTGGQTPGPQGRNSPSFYSPPQGHQATPPMTPSSNPITPTALITARAEFFNQVRARVSKMLEVISTKLNLPPTTQPLGLLMVSGGTAGSTPPTPGNTPLSDDFVRVVIEPDTHITLDGRPFNAAAAVASAGVWVGDDDLLGGGGGGGGSGMTGQQQQMMGMAGQHQAQGQMPQQMQAGQGQYMQQQSTQQPQQPQQPSRKRRRADFAALRSDEWVIKNGQWRLRIQGTRGGGKSAMECVLVAVKLEAFSGEMGRNAQRGFLNS